MIYEMSTLRNSISLCAFAAALTFLAPHEAGAQATDLVCNECVQASDIAPNAVNNSKIANAAVTAAKLASNAVTVAKIANNSITAAKITTAAVTFAKIGPNAVRTSKIANAAVTAAKIAPAAVNVTKIADGAVTAAKLAPDAVFTNVVIVSPVGPAAADNCQALIDALAGITDAASDNPYLLFIEPGIYDCGSNSVTMKSFVDVQGAGPGVTMLQSTNTGDFLNLASNAGLRDLSIERTSSSGAAPNTVFGSGVTGVVLNNLHIVSNGAGTTFDSRGIALLSGSDASLQDVASLSDDAGCVNSAIFLNNSTADMVNVEARGTNGGCNNRAINAANAGTVTARNSIFEASGTGATAVSAGTVMIANSQVIGGETGGPVCVGVYDANFAALDDTCNVP